MRLLLLSMNSLLEHSEALPAKDGMDFSTSDILVDENAFRFLDENSMSSFTHCQHTKRIKLRDTRQCFEKSFVFIHICFFQSFFNNFKAETGHLKL